MRRAAVLATLGVLTGCSDFERIDFVVTSTPPLAVVVTYDEIRIPEGVAVVATARPMADDGVMSSDTKVDLQGADPRVLGVAFALPQELDKSGDDTPWSHVLFGVQPGSTTITVRVDDDVKKEIPVVVAPQ